MATGPVVVSAMPLYGQVVPLEEPEIVIDVRQTEARIEVRVAGDLDIATSPELQRQLEALILARPGADMVIDLRDVPFIDSSGVRTLAIAYKRLTESGGHLVARAPSAMTEHVLHVTGLDHYLEVDEP
ncbi:MAG: STAS domain-containing protein [Actinobacteria bacterium]|nr:STAS domain-containing protein [Actinomycetota bacterium]